MSSEDYPVRTKKKTCGEKESGKLTTKTTKNNCLIFLKYILFCLGLLLLLLYFSPLACLPILAAGPSQLRGRPSPEIPHESRAAGKFAGSGASL